MDIIALAGSRHATQDYGALRCVGSFNNAINFLTESARLLTLHRAGSGLSPMGWQLGARDFDRVRRAVPSVRRCASPPQASRWMRSWCGPPPRRGIWRWRRVRPLPIGR